MSLRRTTYDAGVLLGALRVPYNITNIIKNITTQFIIEQFGVVISVITPGDYGVVSEKVSTLLKDYRQIFITEKDDLSEKRYEIVWELMRSGYMKWLRLSYKSQFPILIDTDNLGNRIIDERLRIWANKSKYMYFIKDNIEAKKVGFRQVLSQDPSFFDYMP
ncbi:MAG: hypothetical protein DRO67_01855 [Candidatus Asgardarchaeum californiense]|nr:MAG: hypothetical protein DRO67_01855 [Candidatus Asgardarchaeum californiense]